MKMTIIRFLLVVAVLVASGSTVSQRPPAEAQELEPRTCADLNDAMYDGVYGISPSHPTDSWTFMAGETIKLVATTVGGGTPPSNVSMHLYIDSGLAGQALFPGQITYTFGSDTTIPPGGDPVLGWDVLDTVTSSLVDANWDVSCSAAGVSTDPSVPGCDLSMQLTADAAVGSFVATIDALWGPNASATTNITIPAGKTAWVLGMDDTGAYYKFIWVCTYLWAPVSALGPSYDAPWNGTPLPVGVVD